MITIEPSKSSQAEGAYFLDMSRVSAGEAVVRDGDSWHYFSSPVGVLTCERLEEVEAVLAGVERKALSGGWAVGFVSFESAPAFDVAIEVQRGRRPLAWFAIFDRPPTRYRELLPVQVEPNVDLESPSLDEAAYQRRFTAVKAALRQGDAYQVNLTFRQRFRLQGEAFAFFTTRCGVQPPPFATFIHGGDWQIASFSPELFFERQSGELMSRPMKGTVARPAGKAAEQAAATAMRSDPKSVAENIMIVDMMRNDFGSVAEPGSVSVPNLLSIERHRGLLQMTSTVKATSQVSMVDLFRRIFPPASVTGAPKVATCRLIAQLEDSPRGVYCGAIGYLAPGRERFSVGIRTAWIDAESGHGEFGIGSGLVWDSEVGAEYAECLAKRDLLVNAGERWALLESIPQHGLADKELVARHLDRLQTSAGSFGIHFDREAMLAELNGLPLTPASAKNKVRVRLFVDGAFAVACGPSALPPGLLSAVLADSPVNSDDPNLRIKSTSRSVYDRHLDAHPDADEVLLFNERGELTEFCRGNLLLLLDGCLVTPDPAVGCLAGIGISRRLDSGAIYGRPTVGDLSRCTAIYFVNSVVGTAPVKLGEVPGKPNSEAVRPGPRDLS